MEKNKKVVFISGIDYESPIQIGDHHLARQFARNGWQVLFLSLPVTPYHLFSKNINAIKRRFKNYLRGGKFHDFESGWLYSYVPGALILPKISKVLGRPFFLENWHRTIIPGIGGILKKLNFETVNLIYIRDPFQSFLLNKINHENSVFRIADNDSGFSFYNEDYQKIEEKVIQSVDIVLYTAKELKNFVLEKKPKRVEYFPNGVDFNHFSHSDSSIPTNIKKIKKPIVMYTGSIESWFDFDLINQLTEKMPDVSFVVIGPNEKFKHKFITRNNLHLLGEINHQVLPNYLHHADIGIIPFDVENNPELIHAVNPIKLLEYFSCGLPVVSTRWNELEKMRSPAYLCEGFHEFQIAIEYLINKPIDPLPLRNFAKDHDWSKSYKLLTQLLNF